MDPESSIPTDALPLADELATVFSRMTGLLLTEETVDGAPGVLAALAHETVAGSAGAAVTVVDAGARPRTTGATDDVVSRADALQYDLAQGPCLEAIARRQTVRVDDVATDRRWPRWSAAVLPLALRSCLSAPLVAGERSLGALKVYGAAPHSLAAGSERLLGLFAGQAAVLVAQRQLAERAGRARRQLRTAVRSRDVVSMAKGVLMGRQGVSEDVALRILLARARERGVQVADAASSLVAAAVGRRR